MISQRTKNALTSGLVSLLGRRRFARLGRFLWMASRLDSTADMATNGEQRLQRMFAASLRRSSDARVVIFDVGANVGDWTSSMLQELRHAGFDLKRLELHLFEPAPAPRALLAHRFADSPCSVYVRDVALTDRGGKASFSILGETDGMNSLQPLSRRAQRVIDVTVQTVDEYCSAYDIERVDFMKIDTEGNDLRVLTGARQMLDTGKIRVVQFEYNQLWIAFRSFLKDVFDFVEPRGYHVGKVTPQGIEAYSGWHHELESFRLGNYLLWHDPLPQTFATIPWWNE